MTTSELPESWAVSPLGHLGVWNGGGTPTKSNPAFWKGDIPWVSPKDIKVARLWDSSDHLSTGAIEASATTVIPKRSVLVVTRSGILAHTLPIAINEVPLAINQDLKAITPFPGIDAEYLAWALRGLERRILKECSKHGTTVHSVEVSRLQAFDVPVAPQQEQRRIVAKIEELFSELDKGIESLKTARRQLEVYRQSILKHAFEGKLTAQWREENKDKLETPKELLARVKRVRAARYEQQIQEWERAVKTWEAEGKHGKRPLKPGGVKPQMEMPPEEVERLPSIPKGWCFVRLCQVAEVGSGMSVSATRKLENSLKIPYLRVANVQRGFLDLTEVKHMTIERSQLESLQLKQWDVLFNEGGDRDKLGRGWIWQSEITPCITQNHVFRASPYLASEFNSKLLSFWANTFGKRYFDKAGKQTTNLASINKMVLSQFPVPLIPYAEQEEICTQIDQSMMSLDAQGEEIDRALGMADLLRQSILKKAFAGNLVPQDPSDEPASILLEKIRLDREKAGRGAPTATRRRKAKLVE